MLLWWKNQFSFLFTRLLFFGFLKQVLFILTMIICFESVSIIKYIHVIILFQLSGNNRNSLRVTVMSFHQQIKNFWHVQNHGSYNFSPTNFKDALRTNYSFLLHYRVIYHFYFFSLTTFCDNTTGYATWSCIWGTEKEFEIEKQIK